MTEQEQLDYMKGQVLALRNVLTITILAIHKDISIHHLVDELELLQNYEGQIDPVDPLLGDGTLLSNMLRKGFTDTLKHARAAIRERIIPD